MVDVRIEKVMDNENKVLTILNKALTNLRKIHAKIETSFLPVENKGWPVVKSACKLKQSYYKVIYALASGNKPLATQTWTFKN